LASYTHSINGTTSISRTSSPGLPQAFVLHLSRSRRIHHLLTSFTESGEVFQPIPGAISDLSGPFWESDDDPESDLIDPWSWLPTPLLHLARVSLLFSRFLQRVPLVDPTAVSKSTAVCAMAFQRRRLLHNAPPRCGLPRPHFTSI
jgi:hypothetical protein